MPGPIRLQSEKAGWCASSRIGLGEDLLEVVVMVVVVVAVEVAVVWFSLRWRRGAATSECTIGGQTPAETCRSQHDSCRIVCSAAVLVDATHYYGWVVGRCYYYYS